MPGKNGNLEAALVVAGQDDLIAVLHQNGFFLIEVDNGVIHGNFETSEVAICQERLEISSSPSKVCSTVSSPVV